MSTSPQVSNVIVFVVGGVTFEEAKDLAMTFNKDETRVIVGGNFIHNSKSFMADISQIQMMKEGGGARMNFEIEMK